MLLNNHSEKHAMTTKINVLRKKYHEVMGIRFCLKGPEKNFPRE